MTFVDHASTAEHVIMCACVQCHQGFEIGAFQKLDTEGVKVHCVTPMCYLNFFLGFSLCSVFKFRMVILSFRAFHSVHPTLLPSDDLASSFPKLLQSRVVARISRTAPLRIFCCGTPSSEHESSFAVPGVCEGPAPHIRTLTSIP